MVQHIGWLAGLGWATYSGILQLNQRSIVYFGYFLLGPVVSRRLSLQRVVQCRAILN